MSETKHAIVSDARRAADVVRKQAETGDAEARPDCNFIICMRDDGYEIVGPFGSHDELIAYGERWQDEHGDDPRWQSLYLADPHAAPVVVGPGDRA